MSSTPLEAGPLLVKINGVPAHYLLVHGAVVFIPLAALAALAFVVPGWRGWLRIPLVVASVLAFVFVWAAFLSGSQLQEAFFENSEAVHKHEELADVLRIVTSVFAVAAVVTALFALRASAAIRNGAIAVTGALAVLTLVYVVLTGDAGAKAANPPEQFEQSVPSVPTGG